jgi:hypothetical protein
MNDWTTQYWQGKAKRPWATANTGVGQMENLAQGRQNRPWTFY